MSVDLARHGHVLLVTINRPEQRNALDGETITGLGAAFASAEVDSSVRAIVLTGAGDKAFCAGMDLKAFAAGKINVTHDPNKPGTEIFTRRIYPKPVIAAVNATAVAGGFELMMACDLIVASEHAMFGLAEVKRGLVATGGGTRLPKRIPIAIALEIGLTGDLFSAQRAYELGLINRVVPREQVVAEALALATRVANNGPLALAVTKRLMIEEIGEGAWAHIRETAAPVFASADAKEGAAAFAERRAPNWQGR
jgi:enoyl-CoA hydratase